MTSPHTSAPHPPSAGQGALYIDVRTPGEFAAGHLDGALNLPLGALQASIAQHVPDRHRELVLYCASGARSGQACTMLLQMGYTRTSNGGGIASLALASGQSLRRA